MCFFNWNGMDRSIQVNNEGEDRDNDYFSL